MQIFYQIRSDQTKTNSLFSAGLNRLSLWFRCMRTNGRVHFMISSYSFSHIQNIHNYFVNILLSNMIYLCWLMPAQCIRANCSCAQLFSMAQFYTLFCILCVSVYCILNDAANEQTKKKKEKRATTKEMCNKEEVCMSHHTVGAPCCIPISTRRICLWYELQPQESAQHALTSDNMNIIELYDGNYAQLKL